MTLSRAQIKDVKELFYLEQNVFEEANFPLSLRAFRYHIVNNFLYVVKEENEIVGYVLVLIKRKKAKLYSLAVVPNYRGKGLAAELLQSAIEEMKMLNFQEMILEVRVDNESALALYKKSNFQIEKRVKKFYKDGCDAYIMGLDL